MRVDRTAGRPDGFENSWLVSKVRDLGPGFGKVFPRSRRSIRVPHFHVVYTFVVRALLCAAGIWQQVLPVIWHLDVKTQVGWKGERKGRNESDTGVAPAPRE